MTKISLSSSIKTSESSVFSVLTTQSSITAFQSYLPGKSPLGPSQPPAPLKTEGTHSATIVTSWVNGNEQQMVLGKKMKNTKMQL